VTWGREREGGRKRGGRVGEREWYWLVWGEKGKKPGEKNGLDLSDRRISVWLYDRLKEIEKLKRKKMKYISEGYNL